jgi:hypothetical protein
VTRIEHSFGPAVVLPCRQEAEFTSRHRHDWPGDCRRGHTADCG